MHWARSGHRGRRRDLADRLAGGGRGRRACHRGPIVPRAVMLLRETASVLMQFTPPGLDLDEVRRHILEVEHVQASTSSTPRPWRRAAGAVGARRGGGRVLLNDGHAPEILRALKSASRRTSRSHTDDELETPGFDAVDPAHHDRGRTPQRRRGTCTTTVPGRTRRPPTRSGRRARRSGASGTIRRATSGSVHVGEGRSNLADGSLVRRTHRGQRGRKPRPQRAFTPSTPRWHGSGSSPPGS